MAQPFIRFTEHASRQAARRDLDIGAIVDAVREPDRILPIREGRESRQSQTTDGLLLRVIVEASEDALTVVTVSRTSKIEKYLTP